MFPSFPLTLPGIFKLVDIGVSIPFFYAVIAKPYATERDPGMIRGSWSVLL